MPDDDRLPALNRGELSNGGRTFRRGDMSLDEMAMDLVDSPWKGSSADIVIHRREGGFMGHGRTHYAELHKRLLKPNSGDEVEKIGDEILEIAHDKNQDVYARIACMRLWLDHVIGRPRVKVDVEQSGDNLDVESVILVVMTVLKDDPETRMRIAEGLKAMEDQVKSNGPLDGP